MIDIFTSEDMENMSLCISQYLTLYYIIKMNTKPSQIVIKTQVLWSTLSKRWVLIAIRLGFNIPEAALSSR